MAFKIELEGLKIEFNPAEREQIHSCRQHSVATKSVQTATAAAQTDVELLGLTAKQEPNEADNEVQFDSDYVDKKFHPLDTAINRLIQKLEGVKTDFNPGEKVNLRSPQRLTTSTAVQTDPEPIRSTPRPKPKEVDSDVEFKNDCVNKKFKQLDTAINHLIEVRNRHAKFCHQIESKSSGNQRKGASGDNKVRPYVNPIEQKEKENLKLWGVYLDFEKDDKNIDAAVKVVGSAISELKKTRNPFRPPRPAD